MLLIVELNWPMLFSGVTLGGDSGAHLWFVWHQSVTLEANHLPSLFLNYTNGVLYPFYAFYGGTLYALVGLLAATLGGAPFAAYAISYVLGFAAACGGWYWIGRIFKLAPWPAMIPGLLFVTSPYYLTLVYGRGDWPEFVGVSMIPLLVASGLRVLTAKRLEALPMVALAGSGVVFFGSHNLTMLWASTALGLCGLLLLVYVPHAREALTPRGVIRVASLIVPALLVNAWFLVPALAYASHTQIASTYPVLLSGLRYTMFIVSASDLFTLSRAPAPSLASDFVFSLPVATIGWVLLSLVIVLPLSRNSTWKRALLILLTATVAVGLLMTHLEWLLALPRPYVMIQFTYRLETYVLLGLSASVMAILVLSRDHRVLRAWAWMLLPVALISLVGAVQEVDAHTPTVPYRSFFSSGTVAVTDYLQSDLRQISDAGQLATIRFDPAAVRVDRASVETRLPPGQLVDTNIAGGPDFVRVTGASIVGRDPSGHSVLRVGSGASVSEAGNHRVPKHTITLAPAEGWPIRLGRLLTIVGLVALCLRFLTLLIGRFGFEVPW